MNLKNLFRRREEPDPPTQIWFEIDGERFWWAGGDCPIVGGALRWLGRVPEDRDIYWEAPGLGEDRLVGDADSIPLVSGDRFFSAPRIINAGSVEEDISYAEVTRLLVHYGDKERAYGRQLILHTYDDDARREAQEAFSDVHSAILRLVDAEIRRVGGGDGE